MSQKKYCAAEANSLTPAAWFKARAAKATRPADRS